MHELVNIYPVMSEDGQRALVLSIARDGQILPIVLYEDKIIDGRARINACNELDIEPIYSNYLGDTPFDYIISLHTTKDITKSQKAYIANKIADLGHGMTKSQMLTSEHLTQEEAAHRFGIGRSLVQLARKLSKELGPQELGIRLAEGRSLKSINKELHPPMDMSMFNTNGCALDYDDIEEWRMKNPELARESARLRKQKQRAEATPTLTPLEEIAALLQAAMHRLGSTETGTKEEEAELNAEILALVGSLNDRARNVT